MQRSAYALARVAVRLVFGSLLLCYVSGCTAEIDGPAGGALSTAGGSAPTVDNQLICQQGLTACNGTCVDLRSESGNCGSCGMACLAGTVCANGVCTTGCAQGLEQCAGTCVNLKSDAAHCGGCDNVCDAGVPCNGGVCGCPENVLLCQGQCYEPTSDSAHCGSCEGACGGGAGCTDSTCQCAAGEQRCGEECSDLNSPKHCGSCEKVCNAGEICALGACLPGTQACPAGLVLCGDACVNLQTASRACGSCGHPCAAGQACSSGTCACPPGKIDCAGNCVDPSSSSLHCGACGKGCTSGQSCQGGKCQCASASDIVCAGACVDAMSDVKHCGDCATHCEGGLPCTDGKCQCPTGETLCDGACVSTDTTAAHCGACGRACPAGEACQAGKCSGPFGDACTSTSAAGLSIESIGVYQAGKIAIMLNGEALARDARPADIVRGKPGRVRVFVKREPGWLGRTVSARLSLSNGDVKSAYFAKRTVDQDSTENSFASTFNFDVKAEDFGDGTRYSVEIVECDGTPAGMPGRARFPATGEQELITRQTGVVKLRFVPLRANGRTADFDAGRLDAYADYLARMYPTSGVEYTVAEPFTIQGTVSAQGGGWGDALDQLSALHETNDAPSDTYYYGLFQPSDTMAQYCGGGCVAGIGFVAAAQAAARHQRVSLGLSFSTLSSAQTLAHELGHNHGRPHSPCGGAAGPDANFPYAGAKIGWWGFEAPGRLHNPATDTDIMGYCKNQWVSDYVYRAWTNRIAFLNGAARELPPPGSMRHFLFLLTDVTGPRWGVERSAPRYPSGDPELADVLDDAGNVIASVTVYRTAFDHLGGASLLVPDPEPGWHAIRVQGEVPLNFGASASSSP